MKILKEAEEIKWEELSSEKQKVYQEILKALNIKFDKKNIIGVWDGIHGIIVSFELKNPINKGSLRLTPESMKKLIKIKDFRWYDHNYGNHNVGF